MLAGALLAGSLCAASLGLLQRDSPLPAPGARLWRALLPALGLLFVLLQPPG